MARRPEVLLIITATLTLSACLRVFLLGEGNYWLDEMVSLHFAKNVSWGAVFWDNNPPLYHFLLRVWIRLFGEGEAVTRTLSVLFSVATTGVMLRMGYRLRGLGGAVVFGVLHAVCALSILMARETRMYALFEFFCALNLVYFLALLRGEKAAKPYGVVTAFMALSHYLAIVPLTIEAGLLVWRMKGEGRRARRGALVLLIALGVLGLSYLNFFSWESLDWQQYKYELEPDSRWPTAIFGLLVNSSWVCAIGAFAALLLAAVFDRKNDEAREQRIVFAVMVGGCFALLYGFGLITQRSVSLPRYWTFLVPVFVAWLGTSLVDVLRWKLGAAYLAFALILSGTAWSTPTIYKNLKEPWKLAAEVIAPYPNALVLTSRTIALKTPYFERAGIEVVKWNPRNPEGVELLVKEVRARKRVWIVENYAGAYYIPLLLRQLYDRYQFTDFSVAIESSAPVRILMVEEKKR